MIIYAFYFWRESTISSCMSAFRLCPQMLGTAAEETKSDNLLIYCYLKLRIHILESKNEIMLTITIIALFTLTYLLLLASGLVVRRENIIGTFKSCYIKFISFRSMKSLILFLIGFQVSNIVQKISRTHCYIVIKVFLFN